VHGRRPRIGGVEMRKMQSLGLGLVCLALLALLCTANPGRAQDVTAAITGTVMDPSGGAVAGATVTAKSVERGTIFKAESNEAGIYRITQLPVGNYDLRVEKQGFQTSLYPAFVLTLNQVARIDVQLKVGQVSQTVEVTGAAPVLKTEATQVDTIINAATNDNLPLASRNYVQLTLLAPGAVSTDPASFTSGNNTSFYSGRPLINGNREEANNFLLDGVDNNSNLPDLLNETNYVIQPSVEALEEFKVQTNAYSAEFGRGNGAIINATIKSGTNGFHGSVYEFLRNEKLDAKNFFDPADQPIAPYKQNQFGATFGGPIVKNRSFFFVDYEGLRIRQAQTLTSTVPTPAMRTGDPPSDRAICRATRTACVSPSIVKTLPSSDGTATPLNDCRGCIDPTIAPCSRTASSTRESIAPLVCSTTLPRSSSSPIRASSCATMTISSSGVAIRITRDARICRVIPAQAFPAPMNRTARRALASLRVTTAPIFHPCSRSPRPSARPTRPAPMMARLFGIPC